MAYVKLIQSGTQFERYTFERAPNPVPFVNRKPRRQRIIQPQERSAVSISRCRTSFKRLVRANLSVKEPPALVTLTMREIVDIGQAYIAYTRWSKAFRRKYGKTIGLIAVPEFQKRGAVHFHVLVFKLKYEAYKNERSTREIAGLWEYGFTDVKRTDGNEKLSTYLAKYMSKAMQDYRLVRRRAYSASGTILRPVSLNTPLQIATVTKDWGLSGDKVPVQMREYDTVWLGRCLYEQFNLESHESSNHK